jgi:catalase
MYFVSIVCHFLAKLVRPARIAALGFIAILAVFGTVRAQAQSAQTDLAGKIVQAMDALFAGPNAGARAAHAKGVLVEGNFTPTEAAALLSRADHFHTATVPVVVRFSNFAGVPTIPDGDPNASPRGMAIKFLLPDGGDTDIVAHGYNGFPAATPEDMLGFLQAVAAPDPAVIQQFLATHPAAKTFAETPKPAPVSYATETFYGVNSFRFTNSAGISHYGRYRLEPMAGPAYLDKAATAAKPPGYLADDMAERLRKQPVQFRLMVQLAASGDAVNDGSIAWPATRRAVHVGTLTLRNLPANGEATQRSLLFTPLNLVAGIAPSADPLLVVRNRAYRISYARRYGASAEAKDVIRTGRTP